MTLTEAARGIQAGAKRKKITYKGEPGRLIGVGPRYVNIQLDSEVERWRADDNGAYSPKYLYVLPEEVEWEEQQPV